MKKKTDTTQPATQSKTDAHAHDHAHNHNDHESHSDFDKKTSELVGKNLEFDVVVSQEAIKKGYEQALSEIAEHAEIQGFRKGKAPRAVVEERVGKTKIYEEALNHVMPHAYADAVQKNGLKPVVSPQFQPKSMEEGKDWVFTAITAEMPKIELGNYKDAIRSKRASDSIWTPGKGDPKDQKQPSQDEKMRVMLGAVLESSKAIIPEIMIREETNHAMSRLIEQLERVHISLEDYLKSTGKTSEQLRQEYAINSLMTLQVEFILAEIARVEKINVEEKEIDAIFASIPDEKVRQANNTPEQRARILTSLRRQKTVEFLNTV